MRAAPSDRGGKNRFDPNNAWTDAEGALHMRIAGEPGNWTCAEVTLTRSFGYGLYTFTLDDVSPLDPAARFAIFTWDGPAVAQYGREMAITIGRQGERPQDNARYIVEPVDLPANRSGFFAPAGVLTHQLRWEPERATFRTFRGARAGEAKPVAEHVFTSGVPGAGNETIRFSLYVYRAIRRPCRSPRRSSSGGLHSSRDFGAEGLAPPRMLASCSPPSRWSRPRRPPHTLLDPRARCRSSSARNGASNAGSLAASSTRSPRRRMGICGSAPIEADPVRRRDVHARLRERCLGLGRRGAGSGGGWQRRPVDQTPQSDRPAALEGTLRGRAVLALAERRIRDGDGPRAQRIRAARRPLHGVSRHAAGRFETMASWSVEDPVRAMVEAPDGRVWLGTEGSGLFSLIDGRITRGPGELAHDTIEALSPAPDRTLLDRHAARPQAVERTRDDDGGRAVRASAPPRAVACCAIATPTSGSARPRDS